MTVTRLTIRALLFRRRSLALLFPVAAVVFFVALAIIRGDVIPDTQAIIVGRLLVTTVAPLVALVLAVTAIGDERESGTIVYLATARISRLQIVAEKTLAAAICAAILLFPAFVAIAILGSHLGVGTDNILRGIAGTLLVATVYSAVIAPGTRGRHSLHPRLGGCDRHDRSLGRAIQHDGLGSGNHRRRDLRPDTGPCANARCQHRRGRIGCRYPACCGAGRLASRTHGPALKPLQS